MNLPVSREWLTKMAAKEDECPSVAVGRRSLALVKDLSDQTNLVLSPCHQSFTDIVSEDRRDCLFSPDRAYRYNLDILWNDNLPFVTFIGLNPSTADENLDDPTIRRCIGFSKSFGGGGLRMLNLFAFRSTDYRGLFKAADPIGPDNSIGFLQKYSADSLHVIAAWGKHSDRKWPHRYRCRNVAAGIPDLKCLRKISGSHPEHPLYLPKHLTPVGFRYE